MIELIALIIFILSFGGIIYILFKKAPVLLSMPQNGTTGIKEHRLFLHIEEKIKNIFLGFKKQILLHKLLSFTKVMILKAETKIDRLLHKLRKEAKEAKHRKDSDIKK